MISLPQWPPVRVIVVLVEPAKAQTDSVNLEDGLIGVAEVAAVAVAGVEEGTRVGNGVAMVVVIELASHVIQKAMPTTKRLVIR